MRQYVQGNCIPSRVFRRNPFSECPENAPVFTQSEMNILTHPYEWYHDGILEKLNRIVANQVQFDGKMFYCWGSECFSAENYPENLLCPDSKSSVIVQVNESSSHFFTAEARR